MIQFLVLGAQTFLWITSAVMSFEQCLYKNSSFYDVMFDMMELLTPTFQNVPSLIHKFLASNHVRYSKAPRKGIRRRHSTQPPNCTSGWHGQTHSKIGMRQCIGDNGNWWSNKPSTRPSLHKEYYDKDVLSWYSPSAFIRFMYECFQHQLSSILHLSWWSRLQKLLQRVNSAQVRYLNALIRIHIRLSTKFNVNVLHSSWYS